MQKDQRCTQRVFDDGRVGQCFRIGLRELVNPSAALENTKRELIGPHRKRTQALVRELLGPEASDEDVLFCEISIINQCLSVNFFKERRSFLLGREHHLQVRPNLILLGMSGQPFRDTLTIESRSRLLIVGTPVFAAGSRDVEGGA